MCCMYVRIFSRRGVKSLTSRKKILPAPRGKTFCMAMTTGGSKVTSESYGFEKYKGEIVRLKGVFKGWEMMCIWILVNYHLHFQYNPL